MFCRQIPLFPYFRPLRWDIEAEMTEASGELLPMMFGSFVVGAELFDAEAFGLSRAEALLMGNGEGAIPDFATLDQIIPPMTPDPQQRLLLEALASVRSEDTTISATSLRSDPQPSPSAMGVYVGVSQLEYARLTLEQKVPVNAYYATGGT